MVIVCITGTPGTGKTELAKALKKSLGTKKLKFHVLHLGNEVSRHKFWSKEDRELKTKIIDMKRLRKFVNKEIKRHKNIIIEGHVAHFFRADVVFVLRTQARELKKRLKKRNYHQVKIDENVEAELMGVCMGESWDRHKKVFEIDTTNKTKIQALKSVLDVLKKEKLVSRGKLGKKSSKASPVSCRI